MELILPSLYFHSGLSALDAQVRWLVYASPYRPYRFFEDEEQENEDHNPNRLKTLLLGTRSPFLLGFMTLIIIIIISFFGCSQGRRSP